MALIADILLIAAALGAAFYCLVLSRRLTRFTNLEDGVGAAIAGLSQQVLEMNGVFDRAHSEASATSEALSDSTRRAEAAARRLELLIASLHDLPAGNTPELPASTASEAQGLSEVQPAGPTFRRRLGPAGRREAAE